ncbi:hypothetical protein GLGR_3711 [Leminorella grimontii ATCC 33999 = DSM 5078]|nr:hypothetical protein GLGR_3711 [Leminorella grimontii ATCC 33999 = DSM 5078]
MVIAYMKNHAIASSLIEALNSAEVSNEMATTVSDMLVSIEKKRVLKSKKIRMKKR